MEKFSHSRLDTFENCGLQFKYQYIDEIETPVETVEAFMGKRVHETLEELYRRKMEGQVPLLDALLQYYEEEWDQHVHDNIRVVRNQKTRKDYREDGREFIKTYYERYHPFNETETVSLEERVELPLKNGRYTIRGFIDRLTRKNGVFEIHDYKTGSHVPSKKALEKDQQLTLYALAVLQTYEEAEHIELVWHYLAHDEEIRVQPTKETMEDVKENVLEMIEKVQTAKEKNEFPPTVSKLCHWCEFQKICPEWEHVFQENKLPSNTYMADDGASLADKYIAATGDVADEELVEELEEALVVYALKQDTDTVRGEKGVVTVDFEQVPVIPDDDAKQEQLRSVLAEEELWQHIDSLDVAEIDAAVEAHVDPAEQGRVANRIAKHLDTEKEPAITATPH